MNNYELCLKLMSADEENEVISILEKAKYWNASSAWRNFGDIENNYSTIGNQQSSPVSALVEKLVNSVDAMLMAECMKQGINPESDIAPKSINDAVSEYFHIRNGKLSNITAFERTKIANNIALIASGNKKNPCYTIIDSGEGQTPMMMPNTLLSIGKSKQAKKSHLFRANITWEEPEFYLSAANITFS